MVSSWTIVLVPLTPGVWISSSPTNSLSEGTLTISKSISCFSVLWAVLVSGFVPTSTTCLTGLVVILSETCSLEIRSFVSLSRVSR